MHDNGWARRPLLEVTMDWLAIALVCLLLCPGRAQAREQPTGKPFGAQAVEHISDEDLLRAAQNPVADRVADGKAVSSDRWRVPVDGGIRKSNTLGDAPAGFAASAYANVVEPSDRPSWQLNLQATLPFPKVTRSPPYPVSST